MEREHFDRLWECAEEVTDDRVVGFYFVVATRKGNRVQYWMLESFGELAPKGSPNYLDFRTFIDATEERAGRFVPTS